MNNKGALILVLRNSLFTHNAQFRRYWISITLSSTGDMASIIIFPLVALLTLGSHVFLIGFLSMLEPCTKLIFSPLIGTWIDRRIGRANSPVVIMRRSAIFRAIIIASIPLAAQFHHLTFLHLCLVAIFVGFSGVYYSVTSAVIVPNICAKSDLISANSLSMLSFSLAAIIGPAAGGFLVRIYGAADSLFIEAMAYGFAALCISTIAYQPQDSIIDSKTRPETRILSDIYRLLIHQIHRALTIETITGAFAGAAYYTLILILATRELGLNAGQIGLSFGIGSIGAVLGSIITPSLMRILGAGISLILGALCYSGILLITPFLPSHHPFLAMTTVLLTEIFSGAGLITSEAALASIQQHITPFEQLGSVQGIFLAGNYAGKTLAGLIIAGLGTLLGIRSTMFICLSIGVIGAIYLFITPLIKLRSLD